MDALIVVFTVEERDGGNRGSRMSEKSGIAIKR